jgi:hypothetical protein
MRFYSSVFPLFLSASIRRLSPSHDSASIATCRYRWDKWVCIFFAGADTMTPTICRNSPSPCCVFSRRKCAPAPPPRPGPRAHRSRPSGATRCRRRCQRSRRSPSRTPSRRCSRRWRRSWLRGLVLSALGSAFCQNNFFLSFFLFFSPTRWLRLKTRWDLLSTQVAFLFPTSAISLFFFFVLSPKTHKGFQHTKHATHSRRPAPRGHRDHPARRRPRLAGPPGCECALGRRRHAGCRSRCRCHRRSGARAVPGTGDAALVSRRLGDPRRCVCGPGARRAAGGARRAQGRGGRYVAPIFFFFFFFFCVCVCVCFSVLFLLFSAFVCLCHHSHDPLAPTFSVYEICALIPLISLSHTHTNTTHTQATMCGG